MEMMDQVCKNENENLRHAFSLKFPKEEWRKNERGAVFVMLGKKIMWLEVTTFVKRVETILSQFLCGSSTLYGCGRLSENI